MAKPAQLAMLAALAAGMTGCAGGSPSNSASKPATVRVRLSEWQVAPTVSRDSHGRIRFVVSNTGKTSHEMVVLRTSKSAAELGHAKRISEAGSVGEAGDVAAGASKAVALRLKPGHYSLVCNLPGHYEAGMHADFVVT
jgi:uncharacterized cupredoxin-like copper-binding protein